MTEFAKIVLASDGEQVLVFMDQGDEGPELVHMTVHDGVTARAAYGFEDNSDGDAKRLSAFLGFGQRNADQYRDFVRSATQEEV